MAKRSRRILSVLVCSKCGEKMLIPRPEIHLRKEGHIKTMWCARCKRKTDFVENNTRTLAEVEKIGK